jgi:hypothetical protein
MLNPEFREKLSLIDSAKIERLKELDEAELIISYQANLNGVDLNLETNSSEQTVEAGQNQELSQDYLAA